MASLIMSEITEFIERSVQQGTLDQDLKEVESMLKIIERPDYKVFFNYSMAQKQHIRSYVTSTVKFKLRPGVLT